MDYYGLLFDGAAQGLLYAPVTIAFALLYAHAKEIDVSIDAAVIMAGVAFGLSLTAGMGLVAASLIGIAAGALVTLLTGAIHMYLNVPFLVGGLVVGFMMAATSTYLVGERLSLLTLPRIFVTPPRVFDFLWLPAVAVPVLCLAATVVRAARRGTDRGAEPGGRIFEPAVKTGGLLLLLACFAILGAAYGGPIHTIHIALVFAVAVWLVVTIFHESDKGLAHRAVGLNARFRLRTDWRAVRVTMLLVTGTITGLTGVVLAQYKAQAISGGSFNIVIGALASYVLCDRLAVWAQRRQDSLRIRGGTQRDWRVIALSVLAGTNPATRAFLGCMAFYIGTQYVIALVRHPELPRLFIGGFLLLVLSEWDALFKRISNAVSHRGGLAGRKPDAPTLVIKDLWKGYTRGASLLSVLNGAELCMNQDDRIVRILGSNASGKTTLFRIIDGTLEPDRGSCAVGGVDITKLPRAKRPVYLITQNPFETVAGELSVGDNIRLTMLRRYSVVSGSLRDGWERRSAEVLRRYGLLEIITSGTPDGLQTLAGNLSGGQAQCLAFAMAASAGPKLILADEPTANLDPKSTEVVLRLIETVSKEFPVMLISHDERVARVCQRTYKLVGGRLYDHTADETTVELQPSAGRAGGQTCPSGSRVAP
jgi:ABC-type uncharacterized transport system ATPase component/ABC-type uncharacterized transport system permease subunit